MVKREAAGSDDEEIRFTIIIKISGNSPDRRSVEFRSQRSRLLRDINEFTAITAEQTLRGISHPEQVETTVAVHIEEGEAAAQSGSKLLPARIVPIARIDLAAEDR